MSPNQLNLEDLELEEDEYTIDQGVPPSYETIGADTAPFFPLDAPPLRDGDKVNTIYFHPMVPSLSEICNAKTDLSNRVCETIIHRGTLTEDYDRQVTALMEHKLYLSLKSFWDAQRHQSGTAKRRKSFQSDLDTFCEGMTNEINTSTVSDRCQVKYIEDKKTFESIGEIEGELRITALKGMLVVPSSTQPHRTQFSPNKLFRRGSSFSTAHDQATSSSQAPSWQYRPAKLYIKYSADLQQVSKVKTDLTRLAGNHSEGLSDVTLSKMARSNGLAIHNVSSEVISALVSGENCRSDCASAEEMERDPFQIVV